MTIGEYIREASAYQYSQGYYDLMRECAWIDNINGYLEDVQFAKESADYGYSFAEGFLVEPITEEHIQEIREGVADKIKEVLGKIKKILTDAIGAFINFFKKAIQKVQNVKDDALKKKILDHKWTKEEIETVANSDAAKYPEIGEFIGLSFMELERHITDKLATNLNSIGISIDDINDKHSALFKFALAASATSGYRIVLDRMYTPDGKFIALSYKQAYTLLDRILDILNTNNNPNKLQDVAKMINDRLRPEHNQPHSLASAFEINVDYGIKELDDLFAKVKNITGPNMDMGALARDEVIEDYGKSTEISNEIAILNASISQTISVYNQWFAYIANAHNAFNGIKF